MTTSPSRTDSSASIAPPGSIVDFLESMPVRYRQRFDSASVRQHARIAHERGTQPARVGRFAVGQPEGPALCVVAVDAPGVLAAISASLMLEGFDIMQAEAFTRRPPTGEPEAVDLFWVRRTLSDHRGPLADEDAQAVQATLLPLLRGEVGIRRRTMPPRAATPAAAETSIHFVEREAEPWLTLEVQTNDRSGLLLAITAALLGESVQITESRITTDGHRVHDRFDLVHADGSRIGQGRLQRIQLAVLAAIDGYRT